MPPHSVTWNLSRARGAVEYCLVPWSKAGPGAAATGAMTGADAGVTATETGRTSTTVAYELKPTLPCAGLNVISVIMFRKSGDGDWVEVPGTPQSSDGWALPVEVARGGPAQRVRLALLMREGFTLISDPMGASLAVPGLLEPPPQPEMVLSNENNSITVNLDHGAIHGTFVKYVLDWSRTDGAQSGSVESETSPILLPLSIVTEAWPFATVNLSARTVSTDGTSQATFGMFTILFFELFEYELDPITLSVSLRAKLDSSADLTMFGGTLPTLSVYQTLFDPMNFIPQWKLMQTSSYTRSADANGTQHIYGLPLGSIYRVVFGTPTRYGAQSEMNPWMMYNSFSPLKAPLLASGASYDFGLRTWSLGFMFDPSSNGNAKDFLLWIRQAGSTDWGAPMAGSTISFWGGTASFQVPWPNVLAVLEYRAQAINFSGPSPYATGTLAFTLSASTVLAGASFQSLSTIGTEPVYYGGRLVFGPTARFLELKITPTGGAETSLGWNVTPGTASGDYTCTLEGSGSAVLAIARDGSALLGTFDAGMAPGTSPAPLYVFQRTNWPDGFGSTDAAAPSLSTVFDGTSSFSLSASTPSDSDVLAWAVYTREIGASAWSSPTFVKGTTAG